MEKYLRLVISHSIARKAKSATETLFFLKLEIPFLMVMFFRRDFFSGHSVYLMDDFYASH